MKTARETLNGGRPALRRAFAFGPRGDAKHGGSAHGTRSMRLSPIVALAAAAVLTYAAAGSAAAAEGRVVPAAPFDRIRTEGAFVTRVTVGGTQHVGLSGDPDDVAAVTVTVADRTLIVGTKPGIHVSGRAIDLTITVPALRAFENAGAGTVTIDGLDGTVELRNDGAAKIVASGRADRLTIANAGLGAIDASRVIARDATVEDDGVGNISVHASGSLDLTINGVGSISYAGSPAHVEQHVNGLGRIAPM
jgi:hypothetical protein